MDNLFPSPKAAYASSVFSHLLYFQWSLVSLLLHSIFYHSTLQCNHSECNGEHFSICHSVWVLEIMDSSFIFMCSKMQAFTIIHAYTRIHIQKNMNEYVSPRWHILIFLRFSIFLENPDVFLLRMHSPKREFTQMFIFKIQLLKFVWNY